MVTTEQIKYLEKNLFKDEIKNDDKKYSCYQKEEARVTSNSNQKLRAKHVGLMWNKEKQIIIVLIFNKIEMNL